MGREKLKGEKQFIIEFSSILRTESQITLLGDT